MVAETNDPLASEIRWEAEELAAKDQNEFFPHDGVYHAKLVTLFDYDKTTNSKHLPIERSDVFGDTAISGLTV